MRNRIRLSAIPLLAVLSMAAVGIAACGGGGKNSGTTPTSAASGQRGGFQAYTDCLRQHGVNLPQGGGSRGPRGSVRPSVRPSGGNGFGNGGNRLGFGDQAPPGVDQNTWNQARQACAALQPSLRARDNGAITAYRNCLADHGVTMNGRPGQLNTADPKVAQALQVCAPLRPSGLPAPSATG